MMDALKTLIRPFLKDQDEEFTEADENLFATARLGIEVAQRLGPVLSEYLETEAQHHRFRALEKMEKVAPTDAAAIAVLQVEAQSARNALVWLSDAVHRGRLAEEQLRIRDEEQVDDG